MGNSLTDVENELRPLFEGGIAYNLALLECQFCMDEVDKLEQLIGVLETKKQKKVTNIIDKAFDPNISLAHVKNELFSEIGESCIPIYDCLVEVKSQCPPWPWHLFKKTTRESLHPDLLMSMYFKLRKEYNKAKQRNIEYTRSVKCTDFLTLLLEVRCLLTSMMVSLVDDGFVDSFYQCSIFCHQNNTSRAKAFRIALSQIRGEEPLTLVQHSALNNKMFNEWERTLVTLSCIASNKSNSEYLKDNLDNIPLTYQRPYLEPSILNHHRKHLEKCRKSLRRFYFSKETLSDSYCKTDPITASTIVKTVMINYAMLYTFMIIHSEFFIELQQFAKRVENQMKSKYELSIFLNAISNLAQLKDPPHSWSVKLDDTKWAEIVQQELTSLQSLFNHEIPISHWGYFLLDQMIPPPQKLLKEFVKVRDNNKGKFELLKHDDIKDFESKVNKEMAYMMLNLLKPLSSKLLPPLVMVRKNHPFGLLDQHQLSLEIKLKLGLSIEQGTYNNELFLENDIIGFENLEKLHMGLAYHYQNSFNKPRMSMNDFASILDACYAIPINDKKFKDGKKLAERILEKFRESDYSLKV
jgi:hypothetical protein